MTKDWSEVRLIAHRCGGHLAPENTLSGLARAAGLGIHAVEFDVMLSADGFPVLMHDETLERTCMGSGRVAQLPLSALQQIRCGKGWPEAAQEPIPTLQEALARCYALNLLPNVEIKPSSGQDAVTGRVVAEVVLKEWLQLGGSPTAVLLSSFSEVALRQAQVAAPALPRAVLFEQIPADWVEKVQALDAVAVHCSANGLGAEQVRAIRAANLALRCYTVNDPQEAAALFDRGVQAVFADALQELTSVA